jgi:hypothetical protein
MAKAKKPAAGSTIIDVSHPGQSAPADNSKSVIVSSRPILKDPMMVDEDAPQAIDPTEDSLAKVSNKSGAQPLTAPVLEAKEPDENETVAPTEDAEAADEPAKPAEPLESSESPTPPAETEDKSDEANTEEAATPPNEDKTKLPKAETDQEIQRQAAVNKLIDDKKYYLPINTVEKRRSRRFVLIGIILSLLLALAWVDIALDAGLIQLNNVKPVTHFFSN